MDIETYPKGQLVRIVGRFIRASNAAIDPTTVTLQVKTPAGVASSYGYDPEDDTIVVKDSTGHYHKDISASAAGTWSYRWSSTGTGQAAGEGRFIVAPSEF